MSLFLFGGGGGGGEPDLGRGEFQRISAIFQSSNPNYDDFQHFAARPKCFFENPFMSPYFWILATVDALDTNN